MTGYLRAMRRYASFRGRASRAEFWQFTLVATLIVMVALFVGAGSGGPKGDAQPLAGLAVLVHLLPSLAVSVRRLHDTDRSGWLLLINVIPLIGIVLLVIWACQAGTSGMNRFGLNPNGNAPVAIDTAPLSRPEARDVIAEVERLARLKASGSLSEAEFEVLKAQAIGRG